MSGEKKKEEDAGDAAADPSTYREPLKNEAALASPKSFFKLSASDQKTMFTQL